MDDENRLTLPFQGGSKTAEVLKKAAEDCFTMAMSTGLDIEMLKSYMEAAFKQEGFREESEGRTENILIVRLDEIGDNVMTSGFIRELRRNYPKAHITLVVNPIVASLVELCPYVNEVIGFSVSYIDNVGSRFEEILKFCYYKLWDEHFDLAFLPRWDKDLSYFAVFLAYFSGARERIGYSASVYEDRKKREFFLDKFLTTAVVSPDNIVHEAARNFYLLTAYNLRVEDYRLELWYGNADYHKMKKICDEFANGRKIIAVVFGANTFNRVYPTDKFAEVLRKVKKSDNCFILLGGKRDKEMGDAIIEGLADGAINLAGSTTLRETAAALAQCSLYLGVVTGTKHMAAALGLPVIEISRAPKTLKPTPLLHVDRFAPWQTPTIIVRPEKGLSPCAETEPNDGCSNLTAPHCITQVNPDDIVRAYEKLSDVMFFGNQDVAL